MAKKNCANCAHFDNARYKDHEHSKHLGFCNRFIEVTELAAENCIGFKFCDIKEHYHRNLSKAKDFNIDLKGQTSLF